MIRTAVLALSAAALLCASGCIRSKVEFTSTPSGADVFVNKKPIGRTPVDMPFIWYWYYDVKVEKEGHQSIQQTEQFFTPVWAVFPLDFIAEAIPYPIRDTRQRHYVLTPAVPAPATE